MDINNYSVFCGTIICNNAALGAINTGVVLNGRALTTAGALSTTAMDAAPTDVPGNCAEASVSSLGDINELVVIYPNPFSESITINADMVSLDNKYELKIYNTMGEEVMNTLLTNPSTVLKTDKIPSGIYFYNVLNNNSVIQTGKLIAQ